MSPFSGRPLVVLQSFPTPRPTTNPYLIQLAAALRDLGVVVENFTPRRGLLGRYDVFHVHWPETLLHGSTPVRKLARQVLALLIMLRLALTRTPVVRTLHNLERPSGLGRLDHLLLDLMDRLTTWVIRLNSVTPTRPNRPSMIIKHGHYRNWFAHRQGIAAVPGRLVYAGLIRRYKGVERLLAAFAGTDDHPGDGVALSLRIGGQPSTDDLAVMITEAARHDHRIEVTPRFLDDAELVELITGAELVVLPYHLMHNSGGALAALSLGRPVLVPDNEVNRALAEETGPGWVHLFSGELTAAALVETLEQCRLPRPSRPNLIGRDWPQLAEAHLAAYRQAQAIAHAGRRTVPGVDPDPEPEAARKVGR